MPSFGCFFFPLLLAAILADEMGLGKTVQVSRAACLRCLLEWDPWAEEDKGVLDRGGKGVRLLVSETS